MQNEFEIDNNEYSLKNLLPRYFSFWPYFLVSISFSLLIAFFYIRYADYQYQSSATVEIVDKAQDSEMALPTAMTIFNRSMINLENEIGRLSSFNLNSIVVENIQANLEFYNIGSIKSTRIHPGNVYDEFLFSYNSEVRDIEDYKRFTINISDNILKITEFDLDDNEIYQSSFKNLNTFSADHNFPFDLRIDKYDEDDLEKELIIRPFFEVVDDFIDLIEFSQVNKLANNSSMSGSDQILMKLRYSNSKISIDYLNNLISVFDNDGIKDRQIEYKSTIEFVDERKIFLLEELESIENRKEKFKKSSKITDIVSDANLTLSQKYIYNSELFQFDSQKELLNLLKNELEKKDFDLLPINFGLNDVMLNEVISQYNVLIKDRERLISSGAGLKNSLVKSIDLQIEDFYSNILLSIENYKESLNLSISNILTKEKEFDDLYADIPKNEKILRSIERELEIKEALYLLLLQKREEASINFAVVNPTIKLIDSPRALTFPVSPVPIQILILSLFFGFSIPFLGISLWFYTDNKIHTKEQLIKFLNKDIPVIGMIPFIKNHDVRVTDEQSSRSILTESIRMLMSNLRFTISPENLSNGNHPQTIIFTSSVKGEGKTLGSVQTAMALANDLKTDKKVILLGSDLRNPQIHKSFDTDRSVKGITEIIYNNDVTNYKEYVKRFSNLDIIFSGAIPPNPTALLSGEIFKKFLSLLKNDYDYIIIDSAPCLLVSDTFQYINLSDSVVYMFRANFTDSKIIGFINEIAQSKNIKNLNIALNAVGNSAAYGYNYGYSYKYGYNYGYGYGYTADD